ncbi:MAG: hypothetical protein ACPG4W_07340 [Flavobacteriales bacterium]
MKSLLTLFLIIFSMTNTNAQKFGTSIALSTNKVFGLDFFYGKENNRFHFGYSHQFNGQKNTVVRERKANYGLTKIEDGDFFWLIDLGYSRVINQKLTINPEISFGSKNEFTNYKDDRFSDNGYSLISKSKAKTGIGLNLGYLVHKHLEPFIGYHTLKKVNFGLRFILL